MLLTWEDVDYDVIIRTRSRSTFQVNHSTRSYPRVQVDTARSGAVAQAVGVLLTQVAEATGLTAALKAGPGSWRKPTATHDPGKILSDLGLSLALGGDCLADLGLLRAEPGVYGPVASEATVSRTISTLAGEANAAVRAINRGPCASQGVGDGRGQSTRSRGQRG